MNFIKLRPVGDQLFHADGQTDGQTDRYVEANSRFITILVSRKNVVTF
jgi:hypothetical protein